MAALVICWLDDKEPIGKILLSNEGRITIKAVGKGIEDEMALLLSSIKSRPVITRRSTYKLKEGIFEYESICKTDDPNYLWAVKNMLYDYMINGRRIGGYVE